MTANEAAPATAARKDRVDADALARAQRARLRRTGFAVGGGGALTAVVLMVYASGGMPRLDGTGLALVLSAFWLVNLAFPAAIASGVNLRFADPSMTMPQMLWATASTFFILYFVDDGRHLLLMVYLLAMMFGAFRLDVGEYLLVTLSALILYALVIAVLDLRQPQSVNLRRETLEWLVFFIVMVGFSLLGSETSRLRIALQRRNRELREARDGATVAYEAKSRFLAATSHELRTPLNVILGAADVIGAQRLDGEQRDALVRARHAGAHLLSLVNSMIDLSKLETGTLELRRAPMDLRAELDELRAMMAPRAEARGVRFALEVDPALAPRRVGDAARLGAVMVRLVDNAIRFTDDGQVRVSARRDTAGGTRVRFEVADTGRGMDPQRVATLFEPFAGGPAHGGAGLGLALCRQLVALMGGNLEAVSTPGRGSRFSFAIPLPEASGPRPEPAPGRSPAASTGPGDGARGRPRVLVVDDSADNRMLLRAFLKNDVSAIAEAENGAMGVELFREHRYDVVLMDMHMPVMNGIDATRAMRSLERERGDGQHAAILALTADDTVNDRQRSLEAGCDEHLVKPVSKRALLAALTVHHGRG